MPRNCLRRLFVCSARPRRRSRPPRRLAVEPLERCDLLTTLAVEIADPGCGGPGDKLFCEIQETVDVASKGDKIKVHAGTYQPFTVNKDKLTIRKAKGKSNPVINAAGAENGIVLNANGVTLKGLEVQGAIGAGFLVNGEDNTLRDNTAAHNGNHGFRLLDGSGNTLQGNVANENAVDGFSILRESITLKNNTASDNGDDGIHLATSKNNVLIGNTVSGNSDNGFVAIEITDSTVRGNLGSDNSRDGFFLTGSSDNRLQANTASGNRQDGFRLSNSDDNTLFENTAINNAGWGFFVELLLANIFEDNKCEGNVLSGSNEPDIC